MSSLNKVMLIGRLGKNPDLKYSNAGQAYCSLDLATDEGYRDKNSGDKVDKTEWHKLVLWGQQAEFAGKYLQKGRLIFVEGCLQTRKWQDKNGQDRYITEIRVWQIKALDKEQQKTAQQQDVENGFPSEVKGMEDIPF